MNGMIKNREDLLSHGDVESRKILLTVAEKTLSEIRADNILRKHIKLAENFLFIGEKRVELDFERIFVVGFGKASAPMAREMEKILGDKIHRGMVNSPFPAKLERIKVNVASHPLPNRKTVEASRRIVELVKDAGKNDLVIVLVSGGASSLFEIPSNLSIEEESKLVAMAMSQGKDIISLNRMRISLSDVKGGKFLRYVHPARCISLIISDVPGHPEYVGSGPTYGPKKYRCENIVLADNRYSLEVARRVSEKLGISARISSTILHGEPRSISKKMAMEVGEGITIWGGETTVRVNNGGKGGRNQELALYLTKRRQDSAFVCLGTDGIDGPTDAAGGLTDGYTIPRIKKLGIKLDTALREHNSYLVLKKIGDLILTGHTGTNLADLCIAYRR